MVSRQASGRVWTSSAVQQIIILLSLLNLEATGDDYYAQVLRRLGAFTDLQVDGGQIVPGIAVVRLLLRAAAERLQRASVVPLLQGTVAQREPALWMQRVDSQCQLPVLGRLRFMLSLTEAELQGRLHAQHAGLQLSAFEE